MYKSVLPAAPCKHNYACMYMCTCVCHGYKQCVHFIFPTPADLNVSLTKTHWKTQKELGTEKATRQESQYQSNYKTCKFVSTYKHIEDIP